MRRHRHNRHIEMTHLKDSNKDVEPVIQEESIPRRVGGKKDAVVTTAAAPDQPQEQQEPRRPVAAAEASQIPSAPPPISSVTAKNVVASIYAQGLFQYVEERAREARSNSHADLRTKIDSITEKTDMMYVQGVINQYAAFVKRKLRECSDSQAALVLINSLYLLLDSKIQAIPEEIGVGLACKAHWKVMCEQLVAQTFSAMRRASRSRPSHFNYAMRLPFIADYQVIKAVSTMTEAQLIRKANTSHRFDLPQVMDDFVRFVEEQLFPANNSSRRKSKELHSGDFTVALNAIDRVHAKFLERADGDLNLSQQWEQRWKQANALVIRFFKESKEHDFRLLMHAQGLNMIKKHRTLTGFSVISNFGRTSAYRALERIENDWTKEIEETTQEERLENLLVRFI